MPAERLFLLLYTGQDFEDGTSLGELYAVAVKRDPVWCEKAAEARSVLVESPK